MRTDLVLAVAHAICRSRTCEGFSCCQWPAQRGRTQCPVRDGGYDDAAKEAIQAMDNWRFEAAGITQSPQEGAVPHE